MRHPKHTCGLVIIMSRYFDKILYWLSIFITSAKVDIVITFSHLIFYVYISYLIKFWQLKLRQKMVLISNFWDIYIFFFILISTSAKIDISPPSLFILFYSFSYYFVYFLFSSFCYINVMLCHVISNTLTFFGFVSLVFYLKHLRQNYLFSIYFHIF